MFLSGSVQQAGERTEAEAHARRTEGVKDVVNGLRVGSAQRGAGRMWDAITGHDYEEASNEIERHLHAADQGQEQADEDAERKQSGDQSQGQDRSAGQGRSL